MINVLLSNGILILLTILSACFSGCATLSLALGGGLMIMITAGYVTDDTGKLLRIAQLFVAFLFALCTGNWWGAVAAALLLWPGTWQTVLFADGTLILMFVLSGIKTYFGADTGTVAGIRPGLPRLAAQWILYLALLTVISLLILLIRYLTRTAAQKAEEDRKRLLAYRLGEMHEIVKNKELTRQSYFAEKNARLVERENISRNIHNSVGHSITAAIMTLDAADVLFEKKPEEAHKRMNDATERIRGSLSAIRSAVRALDEESADVSVKDLICYFDNILDEFLMDTDRTCDRFYDIVSEDYMLPREHAEFLTGALSELLTNGVKHGKASHFVVKLSGDKAHVRLEVADNGSSDYSEENSAERTLNEFGLKKLASYAQHCGGITAFGNEGGFHSMIELPI